jgi:hypothetical protein
MDDQVERYLAALEPTVQPVVRALAATARQIFADAHETIYHAALGYGPTPSPMARICYIAPQRGYVNLGFFYGTSLDDPQHLLEGSGARMRHVKVRSLEAAANPALTELMRSAWQHLPPPKQAKSK